MVIEMSFIAPILVCAIFVAINMFAVIINSSNMMSQTYMVLYNRREYMISDEGKGDMITAETDMIDGISDEMMYFESIEGEISLDDSGISDDVLGVLSVDMKCTEKYMGMGLLVVDERIRGSVTAKQELRNVGDNLRRWQIYGDVLSE